METDPSALEFLVSRINDNLVQVDDEAWHYSRLRLTTCLLDEIPGAKVLWLETIATDTREGQRLLRELKSRVSAAVGHLSELPILQIVICRMNQALLDLTTDDYWQHRRPFITWAKKSEMAQRGTPVALWYQIEERLGDDEDLE